MDLKLIRGEFTDKSTFGELHVNGQFECHTSEQTAGISAIPAGTYDVVIDFSPQFQRLLPLLKNVPNFGGVCIHPGDTGMDTEGCILIGRTRSQDSIRGNRQAFEALFAKLQGVPATEKITLEITAKSQPAAMPARAPIAKKTVIRSSMPRRVAKPRRTTGKQPLRGAFNQGGVPTIACFNKAKTKLGVNFDKLIAAMQMFIDEHVAPVWGTPAKLVKSTGFVKGAWAMVFLDDADAPGALAYHDLTPDGLPEAKVFVKTTLKNNDLVSVSASHELVEMLVDPAINMMTTGPDPELMYAYESADPVEALSFPVKGIQMTDFVFPAYFEAFHKPGSVQFDYMKKVREPFQILSGGYQIIFKNGKWKQIYGSKAKKKAFKREDRRDHRSEQRAARKLKRADLKAIVRAGRKK
jgi:hypothetical protein